MIFNMAVAAILDFVGYKFWGLELFRDLIFGVCIKFGVNPFKEVAELLPFNWFENGGLRHLGFLDYVNFDDKSVRPHFQPLFQVWCKCVQ